MSSEQVDQGPPPREIAAGAPVSGNAAVPLLHPWVGAVTGLLDAWSGHLAAVRGRAPGTVAAYRQAVEAALRNLDVRDVEGWAAVTFTDLDRYLRALHLAGRARSTVVRVVAALRSWGEYAALVGAAPANPAVALRGPRVYVPEAPSLTEGETRRLLFGARPGWLPTDWRAARDQVLLAVAFGVGLRVSEPGRLRLADTQCDSEGQWSILVTRAKWADEDVRIAIRDPQIARMLAHWATSLRARHPRATASPALFPSVHGRTLSAKQVQRIFRAAVAAAEIRPRGRRIGFHVLRHTLATLCAQAGWELRAIQRLLRHRSERTTLRYIHTRDERLDRLWRQKHPLRARRPRGPAALAGELAEVLSIR